MKSKIIPESLRKSVNPAIIVILVFGVLILPAFLFFCAVNSLDTAQSTMERNIRDLKKQCDDYEDFLSIDEAKSLIRISEKAENLSAMLAFPDGDERQNYIDTYFDSQRLNCILILDENMNPDKGISFSERDYEEWQETLSESTVAMVLEYPKKIYMERLKHNGEIYDIAAVSRTDAGGIVFCAMLQNSENLSTYYASVRNLLAANETSLAGSLYITDEETIVASNHTNNYTSTSEVPELKALDSADSKGEITKIKCGNNTYYGGCVDYRNYKIYAFYPEREIFAGFRTYFSFIICLYVVISAIMLAIHYWEKASNEQEINQSKTDFLHRMSHDIRTPINVILGMLEIAEKNPDDTELLKECRKKSKSAAEYLLELVNDIMTVNKADADILKETDSGKSFDLFDETEKLYIIAKERAEAAGVILEKPSISGENIPLKGNALYLRQIMMNIINNAVQYSHKGGSISFSVSEMPSAKKEGIAEVRFICEDHGIGMSEEFQQRMFEPFAQEKTDAVNRYSGVGLGLSIVQKLVRKLDGKIMVKSQKAAGTRMEIVLSYEYSDKPAESRNEETEDISLNGLTLLLAEDNELNMEIAEHMLKSAGANVIKAYDGREAVECFSKSAPGLISAVLTDLTMPEMDGLEVTRCIRAFDRPDAKTVPVIAVTANLFEEDIKACFNAGMNGFLSKPLKVSELLKVISQQIRKEESGNG